MMYTNTKLRVSVSLLLLCIFLILGGCSAGKSKQPLQKLTLMLDWYPNAVHSLFYAAESQGFFAEEGLDVEIRMPADGNDGLKLVAANQIDLALSYQPQVLMARAEQIPVQSIAAIVRHPLNHLLIPAEGAVQRPKDLMGKSIGYSSIPLYEAMVKTMIKNDGGDPQSANLIDVGFDLIPAISTDKVDAIMGGFINHEALILAKEGHPVTSIHPTDYGVPDYYELVLVASEQGLKNNNTYLKKFMTAITKGQQYVQEHPDEALSILLKHEDATSPLDKDIEQQSLQILLPLMDAGDQTFGYQDPESWENVHQWLIENQLLHTDVKTEEAFINL
ncbi:ABC transporter substrate-binding protein [Paenibacillus wynnii]